MLSPKMAEKFMAAVLLLKIICLKIFGAKIYPCSACNADLSYIFAVLDQLNYYKCILSSHSAKLDKSIGACHDRDPITKF